MKILQIGVGGIGSNFIREVCECIEQELIGNFEDITIADSDIVELGQLKYQSFKVNEVGFNKSEVIAKRFAEFGIKSIKERIVKEEQIKGFDLIILCVDNDKIREMVIKYAFKNGIEFLDLRATGRRVTALPKMGNVKDNLKYIDSNDTTEYSCQNAEDLEKGFIQKGNKIVALCGIQMLLNLMRGHNNKPISMVI
jgi:molybdopterin/thiamine biosynthesis adenylyltransferase